MFRFCTAGSGSGARVPAGLQAGGSERRGYECRAHIRYPEGGVSSPPASQLHWDTPFPPVRVRNTPGCQIDVLYFSQYSVLNRYAQEFSNLIGQMILTGCNM